MVFFLESGSLSSEEALPDEVFDWLLNLGECVRHLCLQPGLNPTVPFVPAVLHGEAEVGSAALGCLRDLLANPSDTVKEIELDFATVRRLLTGLGMKEDAFGLLSADSDDDAGEGEGGMLYPLPASEGKRQEQVWRLLHVVQMFAR